MRRVLVWTDGSTLRQHGPSGWAALLRCGDREKLVTGGCREATNNYAEIMGVVVALEALKKPAHLIIHSDSQYVVNCATSWARSAKKRGWKTASGSPFANHKLWSYLLDMAEPHYIEYEWVRGHAGLEENERVDRASREVARRMEGRR